MRCRVGWKFHNLESVVENSVDSRERVLYRGAIASERVGLREHKQPLLAKVVEDQGVILRKMRGKNVAVVVEQYAKAMVRK
jgi:hypothetical protein